LFLEQCKNQGVMGGTPAVGRLSIVHRAQFADLRVLAGGEAKFFQSLFEELSNVPLACCR
jgi:hypothetical protein